MKLTAKSIAFYYAKEYGIFWAAWFVAIIVCYFFDIQYGVSGGGRYTAFLVGTRLMPVITPFIILLTVFETAKNLK